VCDRQLGQFSHFAGRESGFRTSKGPSSRPPCESTVKSGHRCPGRVRENAHCVMSGFVVRTSASRLVVPALRRTGHPFAASGREGRRKRLSWCSLPVPKQFVESLRRAGLLRSVGNRRDLAVCASMILCFISGQSLRCPGLPLLCRDELAALPVHGQQPRHHLAGYGQRRPVPVAPFHRLLMEDLPPGLCWRDCPQRQ
jgi:hypothetical protein